MRGLSNTLAGLIILTFILAAVLPMLIDVISSSTQTSLRAAELASIKSRSLAPSLNITLDTKLTTPTMKAYRVENMGSNIQQIMALVIEDSLNKTYIVQARSCLTGCNVGTATVTIQPLLFYKVGNRTIDLLPRGEMLVEITNGKLIGVMTATGSYVPAKGGIMTTIEVAKYAEYAAVAGGVQTNYFDLSSYNDLSDLINDPNVALVTDPSQDRTDSSILWRNMIKSKCYYDRELIEGGFKPDNRVNNTKIKGLVMFNIQPIASSFIIGGRSNSYSMQRFEAGALIHFYSLAPFNASIPGIIAAVDTNGKWFAIFNIAGGIYTVRTDPPSDALNELDSQLGTHMYYGDLNIIGLTTPLKIRSENFQMEAWFDTSGWGLIAHGIIRDIYNNRYEATLYCSPTGFEAAVSNNNALTLTFHQCAMIGYNEGRKRFYIADNNDISRVIVYLSEEGYNATGDGNYTGHYKYASIRIDGKFTKRTISYYYNSYATSLTDQINRPLRIKLFGETSPYLIATYDAARASIRAGSKAFGHYYYSGNDILGSGNGILILGLSNVTITLFTFSRDYVSGLEPYTIFLDTDANGLAEMNFLTEDYSFGGPSDYDDLNSMTNIPYLHFINNGLRIRLEQSLSGAAVVVYENILPYDVEMLYLIIHLKDNHMYTIELRHIVEPGESGKIVLRNIDYDDVEYVYVLAVPAQLEDLHAVRIPMGCLDKSLKPLYLKFKGSYAVNGGNIAEVSIQIRYQFHDNAGPDVDDVDDPMQFLMGFRLVDRNGTVYSTSDYIYQQLMTVEDTWPPNAHWVSDSVFLLVPDKNETYYVVFALNDPYGWDRMDDDMDFSLAVEWLGMWYLYRSQSGG